MSDFPAFETFDPDPKLAGQLIPVSVNDDAGEQVKGLFMQYPDGRIGGLTLSYVSEMLDAAERFELEYLIGRSVQGYWHLSGLYRTTPEGSYARMLVVDAQAAVAEQVAA